MGKDKEKIKIPKSVKALKMSMKKYAKKNDIKLKGKGMSKKDKKRANKRLLEEYSEFAINGLNRATKILVEHPENKKVEKVSSSVENIITNTDVMKRMAKIYKKDKKSYPNLIYLPYMIMNTLSYYNNENLPAEEKEVAERLNPESLVNFCESILKKQVKKYESLGLDEEQAFLLATTIPRNDIFKNRKWYKSLISLMYEMAEKEEVDIDLILKSVVKINKDGIGRKKFLREFFSELILMKSSNKNAKFTETQKELHNGLIERALGYLNGMKSKDLKELLKDYIKRRKHAETYKTDGKRIIKFTEHSNSNSPYTTIKSVVTDLISDKADNELYLS